MPSAPESPEARRRQLEASLQADPDDARGWLELGRICALLGDPPAAMQHLAESARRAPDWTPPIAALADLLRDIGRRVEARTAYERALEISPEDAETQVKLGNLLSDARGYADAVRHYDLAAAARADWYLPHLNRGNALSAMGDLEAAREAYDTALALGAPGGVRLRRDLMLPVVATDAESYAAAHDAYAKAISAHEAAPPRIGNPLVETPGSRFFLAYHGKDDRDLQTRLAKIYLKGCPTLAWTAPHCGDDSRAAGPRRIAVVSRFLFDHSIGRLTIGLLRRLAVRPDCELHAFETAAGPDDAIRREVGELSAARETLPPDLGPARERIAAARPDLVLYPEIGMDPVAYFLAFARLAPVQCVTWGHPMTTGIPAMDYFFSCRAAEPDNAEDQYSETLVRIGGLPFSYIRPPRPEPLGTRGEFGLPADATLHFVAQSLFKVHPSMDPAFARILAADPRARLLFLEGHDPAWGETLRRRFAASLGGIRGRIVFLPRQSHEDYLRLLALSDVSLDTFPFCGGNTTYQALAMGTPVVTLPGPQLRGRFSLAINDRMGLRECVANDVDDYAAIAIRLGVDADFATAVRKRIAEGCRAIFEDPVVLDAAEDFLMTATPPAARESAG